MGDGRNEQQQVCLTCARLESDTKKTECSACRGTLWKSQSVAGIIGCRDMDIAVAFIRAGLPPWKRAPH